MSPTEISTFPSTSTQAKLYVRVLYRGLPPLLRSFGVGRARSIWRAQLRVNVKQTQQVPPRRTCAAVELHDPVQVLRLACEK